MNEVKLQPYLIYEHKIEYKVYPNGVKCNDNTCNEYSPCKTCGRYNMVGEAKIPTGKKILTD